MQNGKYTMANMDLVHPPAAIPVSDEDRIAGKAARLANVYGLRWNDLTTEERGKFISCVQVIESVAKER